MAKRKNRAQTDSSERSARFDVAAEMYGDARCSVIVGITLADAWTRARADWPNIDQSHDPGDAACVLEVDGQCVMMLSATPSLDVLAHESVHVAVWVMTSRGIPVTAENDEVLAYLVQWVARHAWPCALSWLPTPIDLVNPTTTPPAVR